MKTEMMCQCGHSINHHAVVCNGVTNDIKCPCSKSSDQVEISYRRAEETKLHASIYRLELDAKLADAAYLDHLEALRKQTAEIAALKAQIAELTKCKHPRVTIHARLWRASTLEEPAEWIEKAQCEACGKWMDTNDIPEDAEVIE